MEEPISKVGEISLGMSIPELTIAAGNMRATGWAETDENRPAHLHPGGFPGPAIFTYGIEGERKGRLVKIEVFFVLELLRGHAGKDIELVKSGHFRRYGDPQDSFGGEGRFGEGPDSHIGCKGRAAYFTRKNSGAMMIPRIGEGKDEKTDPFLGDIGLRTASKEVFFELSVNTSKYLKEIRVMRANG